MKVRSVFTVHGLSKCLNIIDCIMVGFIIIIIIIIIIIVPVNNGRNMLAT